MMGAAYKTKKDLIAHIGQPLDYIETSMFGPEYHGDGTYAVVGPDPYTKRSWYANVTVENGVIAAVDGKHGGRGSKPAPGRLGL